MSKRLFGFAVLGLVVALGGVLLSRAQHGSIQNEAFAIVTPPTSTPGPAATPKPGPIIGMFDIDAGPGLFRCIERLNEDPATLALEASAQCYSDTATGSIGVEPPCDAAYATGVTPAPTPTPSTCGGQVPPPPYTSLPPTRLVGVYDSVNGTTLKGCFADIGGAGGPNVIVVFSSSVANVWFWQTNTNCSALTPYPPLSPTLPNISYSATPVSLTRDFDGDGCTDAQELWAGTPGGSTTCGDDPYNPLDSTPLTSASSVEGIYSMVASLERQDACLNGTWQRQGAPGEFDCTGKPDGTIIPGAYISCSAYLSPLATPPDSGVKAKVLCYFDVNRLVIAGTPEAPQVVNPNAAGGLGSCPPAPKQFCGDGLPGAYPPGCTDNVDIPGTPTPTPVPCQPLPDCGPGGGQTPPPVCGGSLPHAATPAAAHCPALLLGSGSTATVKINCQPDRWLFNQVNNATTKQAMLTGGIDTTNNLLSLQGCLVDQNANKAWGNIYLKLKVDAHTGVGLIDIYRNETLANCKPSTGFGTPAGAPLLAPLVVTRQASSGSTPYNVANWDTDGDGCNDAHELTDVATGGGLRDPSNRWDFFDPYKLDETSPSSVKKHNSSDISAVQNAFGKNEWKDNGAGGVMLNPDYNPAYDRTVVAGSNAWNLGPPDGKIKSEDISAAVKSYGQNCAPTVPANP